MYLNQKWHWFMIMKYVGNYFIIIPSNFIDSYQVELNSTTSLMPPEIPEKTNEVISRKVNSLNDWALVGQFSNSLLTSPKLKDKVILSHPLLSDVILCDLLSVLVRFHIFEFFYSINVSASLKTYQKTCLGKDLRYTNVSKGR